MNIEGITKLVESLPLVMVGVGGAMLAVIYVLYLVAERLPD